VRYGNPMLIKEYGDSWPPFGGHFLPTVDTDDMVLSVAKCANPKGQLLLRLRKKNGTEYTTTLPVPVSLQEQVLLSIVRKEKITLREVGELPLAHEVRELSIA
jgi:hypothetical protein